ncbi:hypothetical protein GCM10010199_12150 [Dactylosporangium roseum]
MIDPREPFVRAGRPPRGEGRHVAEEVVTRLEHRQERRCLDGLTAGQRQAITLTYYDGRSYREVAELLNVRLPAVKTRMRDGLIRLRTASVDRRPDDRHPRLGRCVCARRGRQGGMGRVHPPSGAERRMPAGDRRAADEWPTGTSALDSRRELLADWEFGEAHLGAVVA